MIILAFFLDLLMREYRVLTVETHFAGQVYPGDRHEVIAYMGEVM